MDRRALLRGMSFFVGAGAIVHPGDALAADPVYFTQNGDAAVVVSPAATSPGPNWRQLTVQGAIDLALAVKKPLNFLPGLYLSSPVVVSGPIDISGPEGEAYLSSPAGVSFNMDIRPPSGASVVRSVSLNGLTFMGGNKPFATGVDGSQRIVDPFLAALGPFNALVTAYKVDKLRIVNCGFATSSGGGLALWQCTNPTIRENRFNSGSLGLYTNNCREALIVDNHLQSHKNYGVFITQWPPGPDLSIIRGNRINNTAASFGAGSGQVAGSGPYGNAILAAYAHYLNITGNKCVTSAFSGIRMNACFNCVIDGNQVVNAGGTGVMFECPQGDPLGPNNPQRYEAGIIVNNVVINAGRGIAVTNGYWGGRRAVVSGNHVKTVINRSLNTTDSAFPVIRTTGVGIVGEADTLISNNFVEDTQGPGILCMAGAVANSTMKTVCSCTGNAVKNAPIAIAFFKESALGYTIIESNILSGYSAAIASVLNTCGTEGCTYPRTDAIDYGKLSGGLYSGKPYPNVMIGNNFAT